MIVNTSAVSPVRVPSGFSSRVPKVVKRVLSSERKRICGEINVVFVGRKKIRQLNRRFLDTAGDTDVIAFPYEGIGGDIYICLPVAVDNAERFNEPLPRELTRLVVHGTLHLLGYADWPKKARDKMWARQEPLVEKIWEARS